MNFNNIRNVGLPKSSEDAVPRSFVDGEIGAVEEKIKKRTHLIAASASHHGDLNKGDYQFTWAGLSKPSYKKHDIFNGFLVPSSGYIKKFTLLDTGVRIHLPENKNILDYILYDIGYNNLIPFFTLVLIRHKKEPIDIGTHYFYFSELFKNDRTQIEHTFKLNPNFEKKELLTVKAKDIINIRSEHNSKIGVKSFGMKDDNYDIEVDYEFFTYLATVLIELDPIEEDDDLFN